MTQLLSLEEIQELWREAQSRFTVYEKTYLIPVTHLRTKGTIEMIASLKDYRCFKTHDYYSHSKVIQTDEHRKPEEFRVANGLWYLDRKPVFYKWKHATVFDIPDLPEFCMNFYCPLYRDVDVYEKKYYYINEDSYDDYLREKEGKKSKIDEIIDEAMKLIDEDSELQEKIDEFVDKERKVLNSLS